MNQLDGSWALKKDKFVLNSALGSATIYQGVASGMNILIVKNVKGNVISGSGTQYSRGGLKEEKKHAETLIRESYGRKN